jgi:hypothetical protein
MEERLMKIRFANRGDGAVRLYYDRHGPEGGVELGARTVALVTVQREDTVDNPVHIDLLDDKVIMFESATIEQSPMAESQATWPYDDKGRLADAAEWQQQVMLGLHDLRVDAGEVNFPAELIDELSQLRLRFMEEFERQFPGYGKGRAVWR